jgi:hypothetical protein
MLNARGRVVDDRGVPRVTFYVTDDDYRALQSRAADARLKLRHDVHSEMLARASGARRLPVRV